MTKKERFGVGPLNFRQTIEGMPLVFQPAVAGDTKATIQFDASGPEPGQYNICIDSGKCTFRKGKAEQPSLTIHTPSDVWLKVSSGEISGLDALVKGMYTVEGDGTLLARMPELFKRPPDFSVEAEGQRPAGPLPLPGMAWMHILFFGCWLWFFFVYDFAPTDFWITFGLPIILSLVIVVYRAIFNRPTWVEIASLAFFVVLAALSVFLEVTQIVTWGTTIAITFMALMWLGSMLPIFKLPLTAQYSKWRVVPGMWTHSSFIQPNMAISLLWGYQFLISAMLAIVGRVVVVLFLPLIGVRLLLLVPAFIITAVYEKGIPNRQFKDIDKNISTLRAWAYVGAAIALVLLIIVLAFPDQLADISRMLL